MSAVEFWQGEFGDEYHKRNVGDDIEARINLWGEILECFPEHTIRSILEIGCGSGRNILALGHWDWPALGGGDIVGIEPNKKARDALRKEDGWDVFNGTAVKPSRVADLVFTSGVLIHIPPDELLDACQGIYDAAQRYIVCIEYFSADPEEKEYRGHAGKLWKRDFGSFWLDNFDLEPLGCGFAWKRMTGLDNLTYWTFRKC